MPTMKFTKPLRAWGVLCASLLGILCFVGCESDTPDSGYKFAEVPGMPSNPTPGAASAFASLPAASTNPVPATNPTPTANPAAPILPTGRLLDASSFDLIGVGDSLRVTFSDINPPLAPIEQHVREDGIITLILNQTFATAGKRRSALEKEIHDRYVPDYYKYLTVNVVIMGRFYWVNGEVKAPNRYVYEGKTTVLKAIASAGGFTDFAKKKKVILIRADKRKEFENCVRAKDDPSKDLEVFPGDTVQVDRSIW
jgi:polysaccharide export outer membrane protein